MRAINRNWLIQRLFNNFVLSNLPILIALVILAFAPFLILQDKQDIANQRAGYAYYFLIVGILWKIIQYLVTNGQDKDEIPRKRLDAQS
jgi:hypothetical protein